MENHVTRYSSVLLQLKEGRTLQCGINMHLFRGDILPQVLERYIKHPPFYTYSSLTLVHLSTLTFLLLFHLQFLMYMCICCTQPTSYLPPGFLTVVENLHVISHFSQSHHCPQCSKALFKAWLRQAIDDVHLGVDLPDFELLLCYELPDVMKPYLNMFRLRIIDWISNEVYCALRVTIDGQCWMVESSFRREIG